MGDKREDMRAGDGSVLVTSVIIVDNAARGDDAELTTRSGACRDESTAEDAGIASIRDMENAAARLYEVGARSDSSSRIFGVIVEK
jgi:hypothetical protein